MESSLFTGNPDIDRLIGLHVSDEHLGALIRSSDLPDVWNTPLVWYMRLCYLLGNTIIVPFFPDVNYRLIWHICVRPEHTEHYTKPLRTILEQDHVSNHDLAGCETLLMNIEADLDGNVEKHDKRYTTDPWNILLIGGKYYSELELHHAYVNRGLRKFVTSLVEVERHEENGDLAIFPRGSDKEFSDKIGSLIARNRILGMISHGRNDAAIMLLCMEYLTIYGTLGVAQNDFWATIVPMALGHNRIALYKELVELGVNQSDKGLLTGKMPLITHRLIEAALTSIEAIEAFLDTYEAIVSIKMGHASPKTTVDNLATVVTNYIRNWLNSSIGQYKGIYGRNGDDAILDRVEGVFRILLHLAPDSRIDHSAWVSIYTNVAVQFRNRPNIGHTIGNMLFQFIWEYLGEPADREDYTTRHNNHQSYMGIVMPVRQDYETPPDSLDRVRFCHELHVGRNSSTNAVDWSFVKYESDSTLNWNGLLCALAGRNNKAIEEISDEPDFISHRDHDANQWGAMIYTALYVPSAIKYLLNVIPVIQWAMVVPRDGNVSEEAVKILYSIIQKEILATKPITAFLQGIGSDFKHLLTAIRLAAKYDDRPLFNALMIICRIVDKANAKIYNSSLDTDDILILGSGCLYDSYYVTKTSYIRQIFGSIQRLFDKADSRDFLPYIWDAEMYELVKRSDYPTWSTYW